MAEAERPDYSTSTNNQPIKLLTTGWPALCTFLCALSLLAAPAGGFSVPRVDVDGALDPRFAYAEKFITAENSQFGSEIEGTSVDSLGRVYAVDFQDQTPQLGRLSNEKGEVDQKLFFKWGDKESYFNGIRFFPVPAEDSEVFSTAVVADKKGQIIQVSQSKDGVVRGRVFCKDENMVEPNDVAVAYRSRKVYSTGLNYVPNTAHGDGDIWLCDIPDDPPIHSAGVGEDGTVAKATRLKVQGRANGIEISPDEKHLYAAETWATDMKIYSNVMWKYDIDQQTGLLSKNKSLFFDMKDIDKELQGKAGDIDGVRIDMDGNLFLVRNGEPGEVVKVSPQGKVVQRIKLPGIIEPTNIELGGPHGTTLFIVGKCRENQKLGCIDKWENENAPGRAFFNLYRPHSHPPNESVNDEHDEL